MFKKIALITGISGQDGGYLAQLLLEKGYEVWGMVRRTSHSDSIERLKKLTNCKINLRYGDMTDPSSIRKILQECHPDEVYNLAAQSHVRISYDIPDYTAQVNAVGVVDLISAMREIVPNAKLYHASTSEMFGRTKPPQNEHSLFQPTSPYGTAKLHAYWEVVNARQGSGMFACNGILFNHESERRGENFVTRKITSTLARIKLGSFEVLRLGNLEAKRDWGHSQDYVRAMHLMLQHNVADDYVVATGESHSVRDFLELSLQCLGMKCHVDCPDGNPLNEKYLDSSTGKVLVEVDPRFYRPVEVDYLLGDSKKAQDVLGWKPEISFAELVVRMCRSDMDLFSEK